MALQAKAIVILAKTSAVAHAVASKAYIEAQIPILQASAAKLTALEMSGIAVASVLALTILKGLLGGNKSREPTEAEVAAVMARVEALGLGQAITPMSMSYITNTIRAVKKDMAAVMQPSSAPRYQSPGPVTAQFRGSAGAVSASCRVMFDLPWSADTAASAERAQFAALQTEFRGIVASRVEAFEKKDLELNQDQQNQASQ